MDRPLFSAAPASSNAGRDAAVEDPGVLALREREERKRRIQNGDVEAAEAELVEAYGKNSQELADEAEEGYDVSKMKPMDEEAEARAEARRAGQVKAAVTRAANARPQQLIKKFGVEVVFSTSEVAEFFEKTSPWVYWGMSNGVFVDKEGEPIQPKRIGSPKSGRRKYNLQIVRDIMNSCYDRGNMTPSLATRVMRRIEIAAAGGEWREVEGWHYVLVGKRKMRWVHPDNCVLVDGQWQLKPNAKLDNG